MSNKWFVQKDEYVEGPLSSDEVKARLRSGTLLGNSLIWGKGMEGWQRLQWWLSELPNLANHNSSEPAPEQWHYALNGKSHGPYDKESFVHELKQLSHLSEVMVWTKGMKEWAPLFEFHDLLSAMGVNKRQFPRADIGGHATIKTNENTLVAKIVSISEGGCGLELDGGLVPGQPMSLEIQSPSFRETLHAKAECRYISNGVCGIKFVHLSMETKGAIIQFVRQGQPRFVLKAA